MHLHCYKATYTCSIDYRSYMLVTWYGIPLVCGHDFSIHSVQYCDRLNEAKERTQVIETLEKHHKHN